MNTQVQLRGKTTALVIGGLTIVLIPVLVLTVPRSQEPPPISITGVAYTNFIVVRSRAMAGRDMTGRVMVSSSTNAAALRANPLRDGIEAAERHNLYWMQRYQQQMLRRINSDLSMPPGALPASPVE
jgi:hypothetical protein